MVTRYVGPGGNDGNSGLTWALRKLTLNGVEDTPVVAGDVVWVGPGVYREMLTVDVSGAGGTPIVYIGDVTGCNTDGVGGVVRITGSDNDNTAARAQVIVADGKNYRTFRGFHIDFSTTFDLIQALGGPTNWIIEDCCLQHGDQLTYIRFSGAAQAACTVRRCLFMAGKVETGYIEYTAGETVDDCGHLVENCVFLGNRGNEQILVERIGGIAIKNCLFMDGRWGIKIQVALAGGQAITVNNCVFLGLDTALQAVNVGEIVENFNTFRFNSVNRTNVNVGANSQTYPPLFGFPILYPGHAQADGFRQHWWFGELSEWSLIQAITGANEPTLDLHGMIRPPNAAQTSWGPFQWQGQIQETVTVRGGNISIGLPDAGRWQIFVPCTNTETTISVYVYREANYAGGAPQMLIKQGGQAVRTTTDGAAASQWNLLTDTFTPAACTSWLLVELVSRNTAAAGNYETFFDDMAVT